MGNRTARSMLPCARHALRAASALVVALAGAALLCALPPARPARADGDATVAAALIKSGKEKLAKKAYDDAVTLFERALREAPEMIEAEYDKATALEKKGDKSGALASYRRFLERLQEKTTGGTATADETGFGKLAEKRVAALAVGENELARLEDQFDAALLKLAKKSAAKDPGIAVEALRMILQARPNHAEARELMDSLGGAPDAAPAAASGAASGDTGPFAKIGVKEWVDRIERQSMKSDVIEYGPPGFVLETTDGKLISPAESMDWGTRYALECEVKITEEKARGWLVGMTFGLKNGDFHTAFFQRGQVVLNHGNTQTHANDDIGTMPLRDFDASKWHRLGVKVDGAKIEVWFDGAKVVSGTAVGREDLTGDLGLFQQRSRVEWRVLRAGRIE